MTGPVLHISRSAFRADLAAVRQRIEPSELMLVMKDDAYGHGLEWAAGEACDAGVRWFGSYDVPAGLRVRAVVGPRGRVFAWTTSTAVEAEAAVAGGIDLGVGTEAYLRLVIAAARRAGLPARIHLKIDTGLHRNGIRPEDWTAAVALAREAERAGFIELVGVWSHLAEASDAEDDEAQRVFLRAVAEARASGAALEHVHLTASAASWWRPELRGSLSRVGAFCYGIRSADGPELDGIRPVASLSAPVVEVGDGWAALGIGAFDGLASTLAGAHVGTPGGVRMLRRVDATRAVVDSWPGATVGQDVWIFGAGDHGEHSATALAERIGTVGEETITRLTATVRRVIED